MHRSAPIGPAAAASTTMSARSPYAARRGARCAIRIGVAGVALAAPASAAAFDINPIDWITGGIAGAVVSLAGDVLRGLTAWVANGAAWAATRCLIAVSRTSDPRPDAQWFGQAYQRMTLVAAVFTALCLLLGITQGVLRQDLAMLGRVVAAVPGAALVTAAAVAVTWMLLGVVDQLSHWLLLVSGQQLSLFATRMDQALSGHNPAASLFIVFLIAVVTAFCALALWIELLVRSALVYVVLGFLPVAAALLIWPATASSLTRVVRLLIAIVVSKLAICGVIAIAMAALAASGTSDHLNSLLAGTAMLGIACFSPVAVLRLLPFVEDAVRTRGPGGGGVAAATGGAASLDRSMTSLSNLASQLGYARGFPDDDAEPAYDDAVRFPHTGGLAVEGADADPPFIFTAE
jgi:hypothetical protein